MLLWCALVASWLLLAGSAVLVATHREAWFWAGLVMITTASAMACVLAGTIAGRMVLTRVVFGG